MVSSGAPREDRCEPAGDAMRNRGMKVSRIVPLAALILAASGGTATHAASVQGGAQPCARDSGHEKVLVRLRETGGFAGIDDRVTVYTDGCARFSRGPAPAVHRRLTGAEMRELCGHLKRLRVGRSEARPRGADFIEYTLTYRGRQASRYTLPLPVTWRPVVEQLERILHKYTVPG